MQDPAKDWNLTLAEKKELLGDTLREAGGKSSAQLEEFPEACCHGVGTRELAWK